MGKTKKINSTLPIETLDRLDAFCEKNGFSRSWVMNRAIVSYLDALEMAPGVKAAFELFIDLVGKSVSMSKDDVQQMIAENEATIYKMLGVGKDA